MSKLKIKSKYGVVTNQILNDPEMSFRAKGLFAFLQSKPDDWKFSIERISKQTKEGKSAIREAIKELEKKGYLARTAVKNKKGKWNGYDYLLSDYPLTENPTTEKPTTENYDTLSKKDNSKKDIVKKNIDTTAIAVEETYGNEHINWVIQEFEYHRGFKSQGGKKDRYMAKHLLNNFSKEQITGMLVYLDRDEYAPRVGSVEELWHKRGKIVAGIKKLQDNSLNIIRIS